MTKQNSQEIARPDSLILLNAVTTGFTICALIFIFNVQVSEGMGYFLLAMAPVMLVLAFTSLIVAAISDILLVRHLIKYRRHIQPKKNILGWTITVLSTANVAFYVFWMWGWFLVWGLLR